MTAYAATRARIRATLCDQPVRGIDLDHVADTIAQTVTSLRHDALQDPRDLADHLHQAVTAAKGTT